MAGTCMARPHTRPRQWSSRSPSGRSVGREMDREAPVTPVTAAGAGDGLRGNDMALRHSYPHQSATVCQHQLPGLSGYTADTR